MIQTTISSIIIGMLATAIVCYIIGFLHGYVKGKIDIQKRGKP